MYTIVHTSAIQPRDGRSLCVSEHVERAATAFAPSDHRGTSTMYFCCRRRHANKTTKSVKLALLSKCMLSERVQCFRSAAGSVFRCMNLHKFVRRCRTASTQKRSLFSLCVVLKCHPVLTWNSRNRTETRNMHCRNQQHWNYKMYKQINMGKMRMDCNKFSIHRREKTLNSTFELPMFVIISEKTVFTKRKSNILKISNRVIGF